MGQGVAKEIAPLIPMVFNALPALIQGFQATQSSSSEAENKQIGEVLETLQRDRQDINRMLQNQEETRRTIEGLNLLVNRLENTHESGNGAVARGGPKLRIEMDLPGNVSDQREAISNLWIMLGRIGSAYERELRLASEPENRECILQENQVLASAPQIDTNESTVTGAHGVDDKLRDFFTCSICTQEYDRDEQRPTLLPACGHTFCKTCLRKLFKTKRKCPECREYCSQDVDQLPTNYSILEYSNQVSDQKDVHDLSYDEQIDLAIQKSLEEEQCKKDHLFAQKVLEEEKLKSFRYNEDMFSKKFACSDDEPQLERYTSDDTTCRSDRRRQPSDDMEWETRDNMEGEYPARRHSDDEVHDDLEFGLRDRRRFSGDMDREPRNGRQSSIDMERKPVGNYSIQRYPWEEDDSSNSSDENTRKVKRKVEDISLTKVLPDDDDDCCKSTRPSRESSRPSSYVEAQLMLNQVDDFEKKEDSLYEVEKSNMIARARKNHQEEKARKKELRLLREQEQVDLALALSISIQEN